LRIAAALWWFWRVRSHIEEGSRWYKLALDAAPTPETALDRVRALTGAGLLHYFQRAHDSAVEVLERAREEALRLGDDERAGWAFHGLGRVLLDRRDHEGAMTCLRRSIDCFSRCGDTRGIAFSTYFVGSVISFAGGTGPDVERPLDEAERTFRALGDVWGLVGVSGIRAWHAAFNRDGPAAARHYGDQLEFSMAIDSAWMAALALFGVARAAAMTGPGRWLRSCTARAGRCAPPWVLKRGGWPGRRRAARWRRLARRWGIRRSTPPGRWVGPDRWRRPSPPGGPPPSSWRHRHPPPPAAPPTPT
jgi:tetratricopeptide (TPR) repeat protein